REVGNRENGLEDRLQPFVGAPALGLVDHQELVVRRFLDLDQVRHLGDFGDMAEEFADTPATVEGLGLSHCCSLPSWHSATCCRRRPGGPFETGKNPFPEGRRRPTGNGFSYSTRDAPASPPWRV